LAAEPPSQLVDAALDRDVDVGARATEQEVPDYAADEIRREPRGGLAQAIDTGERSEALRKALGVERRFCGGQLGTFRGRSKGFPTMTGFPDGSPAEDLALVERPPSPPRGRGRGCRRGRGGRARHSPHPQAARRRLQPEGRLPRAEAEAREGTGLADVRLRLRAD